MSTICHYRVSRPKRLFWCLSPGEKLQGQEKHWPFFQRKKISFHPTSRDYVDFIFLISPRYRLFSRCQMSREKARFVKSSKIPFTFQKNIQVYSLEVEKKFSSSWTTENFVLSQTHHTSRSQPSRMNGRWVVFIPESWGPKKLKLMAQTCQPQSTFDRPQQTASFLSE